MGQGEQPRRTAASVQLKEIEQALDLFRLDNGFYPTTEQGIAALVTKPTPPRSPKTGVPAAISRRFP
jgi:general secretion pathway protein G